MEGWNATAGEMAQQLTETEKKRQEIINGESNLLIQRITDCKYFNNLSRTLRNRKESREDFKNASQCVHGSA